MGTLIVRHRIQDYGAWKPVFDEHEASRREYGLVSHTLHHEVGDPNLITLMFRATDLDRAREFSTSQELKDAMERAGVISQPEIWYCEDIEEKIYRAAA